MRLVAALNASNLMSQAATTLGVAGTRPPPMVIETVRRLADAIRTGAKGFQPPMIPPVWDTSPGTLALRDADGRRGPGAVPGLDARGPDAGHLPKKYCAKSCESVLAIPRTG